MIIEPRFRGPPGSGNGGYSCGVLGITFPGPAEVTLRVPPPLGKELRVERKGDKALLMDGEAVVAEGAPATLELEPPAPVSFDEAVKASRGYPWHTGHPYPTCFVCGPQRGEGDGLRIFPGAVEGRKAAAAPWVPDPSLASESGAVRPEIMWAALDCPGWYGFMCFHEWSGMVLLGRLAARIDRLARAGERCVAAGWFLGREGRKIHTGSALFSGGELLALGKSTWIALR
ncbi:MAG TPA: hypothetical protein VLW85_24640 [Myxococcales bacterium]|nr:hypothetical protein [Myxococcales bacterium]